MYKAGKRLGKGVDIIETVIICLFFIISMIWNTFLIKTLGSALSNMILDLKKEIEGAIVQIVEGASQLNMPEVNPLQMMVMEMIKKNMNPDQKTPNLELLRDDDGKFKK